MGRAPCCDKGSVKRGPWSPEEDRMLREYIHSYGTGGNWITLPSKAGLRRCGKSCRLRWLNYLRPNIRHGGFSDEEDRLICGLFATIGSRWSVIAAQLPGRTDNDVKNHWNTKLKKKLHLCLIAAAGLPAPPCVSKPAAEHPQPCFSLEQLQASSGLDMFGVGDYQQHYMCSSSSLCSVDNAGGLHFDTSNSGAVGLEESFIFGGLQQQQQELFPAAAENDDIGNNVPDHQRHYLYGGSSRYDKDFVEGHPHQQLLLLGEEGATGATETQGNRFLY